MDAVDRLDLWRFRAKRWPGTHHRRLGMTTVVGPSGSREITSGTISPRHDERGEETLQPSPFNAASRGIWSDDP